MPSTRRHLAAAAAFVAAVAAMGPAALAQSADGAAVARAVEELRAAMVEADRARLEALAAPELSYGHSGGVVEDRAQFVEVIASGRTDYKSIALSDQSVVMAGDEAIVRHVFSTEFESGGRPGSSRVGVLQVWKKRDGQWRLLARQAFRI
jgi:ketosteroid isomerase-like protein